MPAARIPGRPVSSRDVSSLDAPCHAAQVVWREGWVFLRAQLDPSLINRVEECLGFQQWRGTQEVFVPGEVRVYDTFVWRRSITRLWAYASRRSHAPAFVYGTLVCVCVRVWVRIRVTRSPS
jgi:hypothetical protein